MSAVTVIIPTKRDGRVRVRLPYQSGSANYDLLRDILRPSTVQIKYSSAERLFSVARTHAPHLIQGLAARFGSVTVRQYGWKQTTCVDQCWNARPETAWDCECGCAGTNHGSGHPLRHLVNSALSVEGEYTVNEWVVKG